MVGIDIDPPTPVLYVSEIDSTVVGVVFKVIHDNIEVLIAYLCPSTIEIDTDF